jgi:penicillin-binding protein 1C
VASLGVVAVVLLALRALPAPPLSAWAPSSSAVYDRDGRLLRLTLAADDQYRLWTPLERVSPELAEALLLHEDRGFYRHPGVDPLALVRAAARTAGGSRQGGSTITMQLVRLVHRLDTRTVAGKLRQIALAVGLELRYSKHDILEAHLNLAPYGRNVQGVGAASLIYFGKPADRLTLSEALALAVIPQAPRARGPAGEEPAALREARLRLLARWVEEHPTPPAVREAARRPLRYRALADLPFEAPHLVSTLLGSLPHTGAGRAGASPAPTPEAETVPSGVGAGPVPARSDGPAGALRTTLDLRLQHLVETTLHRYLATQRELGVNNAAAMLVDVRSREVLALVGSADFADATIAGQVDGTRAKRSPGSALKPFIYALAIDQGLIHPASVLADAPTAFGPYAPENFDDAFVGPLPARDALVRSRNVPAVALAARLAQPSLYQLLRSAGVSRMASERHYGLALALGGGEVTMEELVGLYVMLGNRGVLAPLRYDTREPRAAGTRLLSEEASFLVTSMLRDNPPPDGLASPTPVAWKTGTSWGFRDAWCVGLFGPYALAVWVGNFDGSGNPAFVGARVAAPLFFRLADAIAATAPALPDLGARVPQGVVRVDVCAASGDLPDAACPQTVATWFIPGKSPIRVSTLHERVMLDARSGQRACADTPVRYRRVETFERWPSDLRRLFAQAGMPRREVPPARCPPGQEVEQGPPGTRAAAAARTSPPVIRAPLGGVTYQLRAARLGSERLALVASTGPGARTLYWFGDGAYLGSSRPSAALAWLPSRAGEVELTVVDDRGASATRTVRVALVP